VDCFSQFRQATLLFSDLIRERVQYLVQGESEQNNNCCEKYRFSSISCNGIKLLKWNLCYYSIAFGKQLIILAHY